MSQIYNLDKDTNIVEKALLAKDSFKIKTQASIYTHLTKERS